MGQTCRWVVCSSLFILSSIAGSVAFAPLATAGPTDAKRVARAIGYLRSKQSPSGSLPGFSLDGSTADALLAVAAAGRGKDIRKDALRFLGVRVKKDKITTSGLLAKVVLAVVASGRDPRSFKGKDLVAMLQDHVTVDGNLNDGGTLDQSLALLALKAAKAAPAEAMSTWLLAAQCPNGGWAYDAPYDPEVDDENCFNGDFETDWYSADTNTTSYAVQALSAVKRTTWAHASPGSYFRSARDSAGPEAKGGWGYSTDWITTDTNSTGLVLQAYAALGKKPPKGSLASLRTLQYAACGAWAYTWEDGSKTAPDGGATIGAIPGLLGVPFPIRASKGPVRPSGPTSACPGPSRLVVSAVGNRGIAA